MRIEPFNLKDAIDGTSVVTRDQRTVLHFAYYQSCDCDDHLPCISGVIPSFKGIPFRLMRWNSQGRTNYYHSRSEDAATDLFLCFDGEVT